ncbi:MAG: hypothetical protein ACQETI_13500 [Halobacteriota archaeon]
MSGDAPRSDDHPNVAQMELEPDAIHEGDRGYYVDCPECGSPVRLAQIIEKGRCTGYLDADATEVEVDDELSRSPVCTAELSLELVWKS